VRQVDLRADAHTARKAPGGSAWPSKSPPRKNSRMRDSAVPTPRGVRPLGGSGLVDTQTIWIGFSDDALSGTCTNTPPVRARGGGAANLPSSIGRRLPKCSLDELRVLLHRLL
jgi:hypothetical protein